MAGPLVGGAGVLPLRHLDERPQTLRGGVPRQRRGVDAAGGREPAVSAQELARASPSGGPGRGAKPRRYRDGGDGHHHRREGQIEGGLGDEAEAPVDDGDVPILVDEDVHGLQVTVADRLGSGRRSRGRKPLGGAGKVITTDAFGAGGEEEEQVVDVDHDRLCLLEPPPQWYRIERMQPGRDRGEQPGKAQRGPADGRQRGRALDVGHRWTAAHAVHHDERAAEAVLGVAGQPHTRSGEALGDDLRLHDRLLLGDDGVGHDPHHEVTVDLRRSPLHTDSDDLRPEPPTHAFRRDREAQVGGVGGAAQRRQELLVGGRAGEGDAFAADVGHSSSVVYRRPGGMERRMRALITNDDGVDNHGIHQLAVVALEAGLEVVVAAPSWDSSGSSASLTAVQEDGRFLVDRRSYDFLPGVPVYAVEAAPAFISRAALTGAFGPAPDIVLSGINVGQNTGTSVLHSGTVGAVLTAATHGCRGMAVSIVIGGGPLHWETAASFAREVLDWLVEQPDGVIVNVNAPNLPLDEVGGLQRASISSAGVVQATVTELGHDYVKMTYVDGDGHLEPGTDAALLATGYATVTPLSAPCEDVGIDTSGLTAPWPVEVTT